MNRRTWKPSGTLAGLCVPLAFFASIASLSAHHSDLQNSAETAFLGLLATVILFALVFVDRAPPWTVPGTALATAFALWALPAGGTRGATVSLVLVIGLGLAAQEGLSKSRQTPAQVSVALAVSAQILFRSEIWLAPLSSLDFVLAAVLLPTVAGLAAAELARGRGNSILLGAAVVVALNGGIHPELTLVLVLLAAARAVLERRWSALAWATVAVAISITSFSQLATLFVIETDWREVIAGLAWIPVLVPAALRPSTGRTPLVLAALGLALAGLWLLPVRVALMVPVLVLFDRLPLSRVAGRMQVSWSAALLIGSTLVASYPWLRPRPLDSVLAMLGLEVDWQVALAVVVVFWILVAVLDELRQRAGVTWHEGWISVAVFVVMAGGLLATILPSFRSLLTEPVVLSSSAPLQETTAAGRLGEIFVDSYVSNGVSVAPGTPLAEITVEAPDGDHHTLLLRAGVDTGEWAARRPGVEVVAPQPWISWPAPDGPYFAQRYRASLRLETPIEAATLRLRRADDLPAELELAVFQVGARP